MPLSNYQFSFNGVTMGFNTDIDISKIEGLDPTNSRVDVSNKMLDHGGFIFADFLEHRKITIRGNISGGANFDAALLALKTAFLPQVATLPFTFKIPGYVEQRINCLPTRRNYDIDNAYSLSYAEFLVELQAEDPRIYSEALVVSTDSSPMTLTNDGIFPTPLIIELTGSTTDPTTIVNSTVGSTLEFDIALGAGEVLLIDVLNRSVKLDGVNRYDLLDLVNSEWWYLAPGANTVTYSGGTIEVSYRHAWL